MNYAGLAGTIVIDVDPIILRLGHVAIGWYGIIVAVAIVVATLLVRREARRRSLNTDAVLGVAAWAVVGGFAGARAFHVIDRWSTYASNPLRAFALQEGGLAIEGALIGGMIAGVLAARRARLPLLNLADAAAPGVILGQAIGRLGCLVTGDALGGPTSLPWGVSYVNPASMASAQGVSLHPVFAYEALWDLAVFAALMAMRGRMARPGRLFAAYLALYATGKFMLTFLRQERTWAWGLQQAQLLAAVLLLAAVGLWLYTMTRDSQRQRGRFAARVPELEK